MKRLMSLALFGAGVAVLAGCPIYPDNPDSYRVCNGNGCYACPDASYSSGCVPWQCSNDYDCPDGYSCDSNNECTSSGSGYYGPTEDASAPNGCNFSYECPQGETCGADGQCHGGDCSYVGCPAGQVCELAGGALSCVSEGSTPDSGLGSSGDASVPFDAGPPPFTGCTSNDECAPIAGALCLDGECVPPADQCSDGTQCPSGDQCVDGACTPTCSAGDAGQACPVGYACDAKGDCTGNPTPCTDSSQCVGETVCAQDHCVAPCNAGDGAACGAGLECIQGGCVPVETPNFVCQVEGTEDACKAGSICLHHSCYIACDPDAGAAACANAESAQRVQVGLDVERHVPGLRLEHEPRRAVRSDAGQVVREQLRRLHRRLLQVSHGS